MSDFSTLTTKLVTPLLKRKGFKKHGAFERSPTSDFALYRRGNLEVKLTYAFHPYDYPYLGIRVEVRKSHRTLLDRLHPPTRGGTKVMLRAVVADLESLLGDG
jgi:hypothetical protein